MKNYIWTSDYDIDDFTNLKNYDSEADRENSAWEANLELLEIQKEVLNIQLESEIIAIADIGLWNGRRPGYKIIDSGNIKDCLCSDSSENEWYLDSYNFCSTQYGHDGTTYIIYRAFKDDISDIQKENFLNKIYDGNVTKSDISRYTISLKPFIDVFY